MSQLKKLKRMGIKPANITDVLDVNIYSVKPLKRNAFLPKQFHMYDVMLEIIEESANKQVKEEQFKLRVNSCKFSYGIAPFIREEGTHAVIVYSNRKIVEVVYEMKYLSESNFFKAKLLQ